MVGRQMDGESDLSLLDPRRSRRYRRRPRSGEAVRSTRSPPKPMVRRAESLTRSAKLSGVASDGGERDMVVDVEALVEVLSFLRCSGRRSLRELTLLDLLGGDEVTVDDAVDEATDGLRDGVRRGGGGGGGTALPKDEVEDSDPDRERSVPARLEGVDGLASLVAAAAALARSRRESSSRRLLSPGGMVRITPFIRLWGGDKLPSLLVGGVMVIGCGIGIGLGSFPSSADGL